MSKSTAGQRRLRAHKKRKARNMFWNAQPEKVQQPTKANVHADGRNHVRHIRDSFFKGGKSHIIGEPHFGNTWIFREGFRKLVWRRNVN